MWWAGVLYQNLVARAVCLRILRYPTQTFCVETARYYFQFHAVVFSFYTTVAFHVLKLILDTIDRPLATTQVLPADNHSKQGFHCCTYYILSIPSCKYFVLLLYKYLKNSLLFLQNMMFSDVFGAQNHYPDQRTNEQTNKQTKTKQNCAYLRYVLHTSVVDQFIKYCSFEPPLC